MQEEFARLKAVLERKCSDGPVYYYANPGNWGDALIRQGTLRFFRDIGLEYRDVTLSRKERLLTSFRRGTLIYGGGGAWCSLWGAQTSFLKTTWKKFRNVVVLPSTYESASPLPNVTYFARDRFDSLRRVPEAIFCHDMAFYLGERSTPGGEGEGSFLRTDQESAEQLEVPPNNCDMSAQGSHRSAIEPFFAAIAQYSTIRTDRLHVGIAACLLGRELQLHPGSYFKNEAVFRSSIEGRFPEASFHESDRASE